MQAGFRVLRLGSRWQSRLLMDSGFCVWDPGGSPDCWCGLLRLSPPTWSRIHPVLNSAFHESCESVSRSVVSDFCDPVDCPRVLYWTSSLFNNYLCSLLCERPPQDSGSFFFLILFMFLFFLGAPYIFCKQSVVNCCSISPSLWLEVLIAYGISSWKERIIIP